MYQQQVMDFIISSMGGEDGLARLIGSYRSAIEHGLPTALSESFDGMRSTDSRSYILRDYVANAFADQMQISGFAVKHAIYGGSWWTNCVAEGNGLSVTTCRISGPNAKLPNNQFVNSMKRSNQMTIPLDGLSPDDGDDTSLKVVVAYHTFRRGNAIVLGGVELVLPFADACSEMRKDITGLEVKRQTPQTSPVVPVIRVKTKRSVVNGND